MSILNKLPRPQFHGRWLRKLRDLTIVAAFILGIIVLTRGVPHIRVPLEYFLGTETLPASHHVYWSLTGPYEVTRYSDHEPPLFIIVPHSALNAGNSEPSERQPSVDEPIIHRVPLFPTN